MSLALLSKYSGSLAMAMGTKWVPTHGHGLNTKLAVITGRRGNKGVEPLSSPNQSIFLKMPVSPTPRGCDKVGLWLGSRRDRNEVIFNEYSKIYLT